MGSKMAASHHFEKLRLAHLCNCGFDLVRVFSKVGFSGLADLIALFPVGLAPRQHLAATWKKIFLELVVRFTFHLILG